jgi:hypothetical protein
MGENNYLRHIVSITGIFGIMAFATVPVTMVLYFMYSDIPPVWNVLLRTLLSVIGLIFVLIFFSGFTCLIKNAGKKYEWAANLIFGTVCIYLATNFVAHSLEAGSVLNQEGIAVDATQDGILAQGNYLLYGSIGRLITAAYMMTIGILIVRSKIFPLWTGWLAVIISVINILFIPSMFFGINAGDFYSAIGWGNSALAASLFVWFVFIISIVILTNRKKYAQMAIAPNLSSSAP